MAKSRSIGGIYASLSLRDGGFKKGVKSAGDTLKKFGAASAKYAAAGAAAGGAVLAAGTVRTLDQVDALGDLSAQTGVAVGDMMILQRAYKDGGRASEMAGKDIGKMQKALVEASQGGKDPFSSIGLSAKELMTLNPADQFNRIGAAIMRIQNPAERTAKAMEIFGKGGMGLATVFGGLDAAKASLGQMPELAQKFAGAMGEANDLIGHLPIKSDQFFTGFTAGIIGELLPGLEKIDSVDFTKIGQNLGNAIAVGFRGLLDGTIFTVVSEKFYASMALSAGKIQNLLTESLQNAWDLTGGLGGKLVNGAIQGDFGAQFEDSNPIDIYDRASKKENPYADMSKALSSDADELWNKLKADVEENLNKAASLSGPVVITDPILSTDAADAEKPIREAKAATIKEEQLAVNEYQKRGLGLDGAGTSNASKVDEQIDLTTQMRDLLKKITDNNGMLVFGKV